MATADKAVERDCNTCARHVQGGSLNDVPPRCWSCSRGDGLPHWTPLLEPPKALSFIKTYPSPATVSAEQRLMALSPKEPLPAFGEPAKDDPLKEQVGGGHYKDFSIQPITFAMANGLNFCQANVVKYVCRKKGDVAKKLEDLEKAIHNIRIYMKMLREGTISLDG